MKFITTATSKSYRFSIGVVQPSGQFYISIPVSNRLVDYLEYYAIDEPTYKMIESDLTLGAPIADRCRRREMDEQLIQKPGSDRGFPS